VLATFLKRLRSSLQTVFLRQPFQAQTQATQRRMTTGALSSGSVALEAGLILFRRGDVDHRMWYCRMKMPKADRYKTVSLKTTDISAARERAFDQDADVRKSHRLSG